MSSILNWNGKLKVPDALLRGHDEARAEIVRATTEGGRIAEAAWRVAELCLPHFEHEEKSIFPVLALLPYLQRGNLHPDMMDVMPLISDFSARQDALNDHHQSIMAAIEALLQAAHKEKNREVAEFAYTMRVHEKTEDEVIYPTVLLIGKYLQEKRPNLSKTPKFVSYQRDGS
jgi:predicted outer membrane protein